MSSATPQSLLGGRAAALWQQWKDTRSTCVAALSSAVNIQERLQVLGGPQAFSHITADPQVQQLVLQKQLASFNTALALLHKHHAALAGTVRELERLHIEALRSVSSSASLQAVAAAAGPQPTAAECAAAVQDMWMMCRDELLSSMAAASLVAMDAAPQDMAALLQCYADQPNIEPARIEAALALLRETTASQQQQ